jgi:hypothetical protein
MPRPRCPSHRRSAMRRRRRSPGLTTPAFVSQQARVLPCRHARLGRVGAARVAPGHTPACVRGMRASAAGSAGRLPVVLSGSGRRSQRDACIDRKRPWADDDSPLPLTQTTGSPEIGPGPLAGAGRARTPRGPSREALSRSAWPPVRHRVPDARLRERVRGRGVSVAEVVTAVLAVGLHRLARADA